MHLSPGTTIGTLSHEHRMKAHFSYTLSIYIAYSPNACLSLRQLTSIRCDSLNSECKDRTTMSIVP